MPEIDIEHAPIPRPAIVRLRVAMSVAAEAARVLRLPTEPCTAALGDPDRLWLAPDQWLLLSHTCTAQHTIDACVAALGRLRHHAVDSSAALERLLLRGTGARALLAMGCGIDFAPGVFGPGHCVRTRLARIAVVILAREQGSFELLVDRSHADYLARWLRRSSTDPILVA